MTGPGTRIAIQLYVGTMRAGIVSEVRPQFVQSTCTGDNPRKQAGVTDCKERYPVKLASPLKRSEL